MSNTSGRNIRGISDHNWKWLKMLAAFRGITVGQLVDDVIEEWANDWRAQGPNYMGQALERRRVEDLEPPAVTTADGATSGRPRSPRKSPARRPRQPR